MSTTNQDYEKFERIYENLNGRLREIIPSDNLILMKDRNAIVSEEKESMVVGAFGLREVSVKESIWFCELVVQYHPHIGRTR